MGPKDNHIGKKYCSVCKDWYGGAKDIFFLTHRGMCAYDYGVMAVAREEAFLAAKKPLLKTYVMSHSVRKLLPRPQDDRYTRPPVPFRIIEEKIEFSYCACGNIKKK